MYYTVKVKGLLRDVYEGCGTLVNRSVQRRAVLRTQLVKTFNYVTFTKISILFAQLLITQ
jgi:hypothetical protein